MKCIRTRTLFCGIICLQEHSCVEAFSNARDQGVSEHICLSWKYSVVGLFRSKAVECGEASRNNWSEFGANPFR